MPDSSTVEEPGTQVFSDTPYFSEGVAVDFEVEGKGGQRLPIASEKAFSPFREETARGVLQKRINRYLGAWNAEDRAQCRRDWEMRDPGRQAMQGLLVESHSLCNTIIDTAGDPGCLEREGEAGEERGRALASEGKAADGFASEGVAEVQILARGVEIGVPHAIDLAR